ncbi:hypothetical protein M436DRAFT_61444 [Aureobasidium namibiae CBS 147.97]|uniref:Uncharacterized protein n=1 Tax=Aureobasidium namibiae CBS 147.97 TaxID=1043004 RepID=A0A074WXG3_9PEZI|nr:uncharacterized protein M436DRAFT_61444 [Aureobasidium namibiae CBS 147.97]KEQ76174.1 hypothetical protein M436DRAFT_61444 [Aureobasidium namibiae CBS 147.97]
MSLAFAIPMWLLLTYVLIACVSLTDRTVPLCVRQPPTQLRIREHQEHYQGIFLQAGIHSASPIPVLTLGSNTSSYQSTNNTIVFELISDSLGDLRLATGTEDSGVAPNDEQHNDTSNGLGEEPSTGDGKIAPASIGTIHPIVAHDAHSTPVRTMILRRMAKTQMIIPDMPPTRTTILAIPLIRTTILAMTVPARPKVSKSVWFPQPQKLQQKFKKHHTGR